MCNIQKNDIDSAFDLISKSKGIWMELEKEKPVDPNYFQTLVGFAIVELYKGRVQQGITTLNQCKYQLDGLIKNDRSYSNCYLATLTILAEILKRNPSD